jgi:hypothetical protein
MSVRKNYIIFTLNKYYYEQVYTWKAEYYTRDRFIRKLAVSEVYRRESSILNNLADSIEETEIKPTFIKDATFFMGGYYEMSNRYFIAKEWEGEIEKVTLDSIQKELNIQIENELAKKRKQLEKREAYKRSCVYEFRKGPVPRTGKYGTKLGHYYRNPSTFKSKRNSLYIDEDGNKLIDVRAKNLPDSYDDITRYRDKSWKTSCKVKKQWMKHEKKHMDTIKLEVDRGEQDENNS